MLTYESLIKRKMFAGVVITPPQAFQINRVLRYLNNPDNVDLKIQNTIIVLAKMVKSGVDNAYIERLKKSKKVSKGVTIKKMVILYGKRAGLQKWEEYCKKQSITNTFEYKSKKYGMTKQDFNKYNKMRACTKENFISRYGNTEGERRWNSYVETQRYVGVDVNYFISKYGHKEGVQKFNIINKKKANTIENVMLRHNFTEDEAIHYLESSRGTGYFSKIANECFEEIYKTLDLKSNKIYTAFLNDEYKVYSKEMRKIFCFDWVDLTKSICIEFNGDYYHGNPKFYKNTDMIRFKGGDVCVNDLRARDEFKRNLIMKDRGVEKFYTIWENDWRTNKKGVLDAIRNLYV